ncbi:hypothetical protein ACT8ZV_17645 [Nocardioides sp. MAHUQ-72]|uniref:hypothetical protein n=1 Tax=unclassified Nocardioides TaxID=2615069 RepID=UPI00361E5CE7
MDTSRLLPRTLLAVLVLAAVVTAAAVLTGLARERLSPAHPVVAPAATRAPAAALRAWDVRRARAWARGDVAALRDLYVPGSAAGRRDVAMLESWNDRGLRVRGMRMQLLAVDVRERGPERLEVEVTDRLANAVAVGAGRRVGLPRDEPSSRTVVLVRAAGEWRVAAVRERRGPPV